MDGLWQIICMERNHIICHITKTYYHILEQKSTCKVRLEDSMHHIKDSVACDEAELNISCSF